MKKKIRIVVSNQNHAKLYSLDKEQGLKLKRTFNDQFWARETNFTDKPSSGHTSGHQHYGVGSDGHQKEDQRHHFIHHFCNVLYKEWEKDKFTDICLIAEPKTLGDLRNYLHKSLQDLIVHESHLNLIAESEHELHKHFEKLGILKLAHSQI